MNIYYYRDPSGNFGDDLNEWLWERLLPGRWGEADGVLVSAIGTLIGPAMPQARRWVVFSSGAGYGPPPADFGGARWNVVCVRGPLSADVLGLDRKLAVTDGAMLLGTLPEFEPLGESERHGVVFMPHHNAAAFGAWREASRRAGVEFIDPRDDSYESVERIRRARLVVADAMHAAIVADAMRVPWVPVTSSPEINAFKWLDWTLSLDMQYAPRALPASATLERLRGMTLPLYGRRYALAERTEAAARAHYRRHRRMKTRPWWPLRRKIGHGVYSRLLEPLALSPALAAWRRGEDERRLDEAAAALRSAAAQPGFLSEERLSALRREELLTRLYAFTASRPLSLAV